jgi:hypothetical protein
VGRVLFNPPSRTEPHVKENTAYELCGKHDAALRSHRLMTISVRKICKMIRRHQFRIAFLFVLQSFVPHAILAGEMLPFPPISKYVENHFENVQIVLSGRVTKEVQSGSFMGPRVWIGNRYNQVEIIYSLKSISIDEIFEGTDLIKNKRSLLVAESRVCYNSCPGGSHIDDDKVRNAHERVRVDTGKSIFLFCWSRGSTADYIFDLVLRLRRELRKRGHSYDFAVFENCDLADPQKPETLSAVRSYFSAYGGLKP